MATGHSAIRIKATTSIEGLVQAEAAASDGEKKFMPKKPAKNEMGMNRVVMMVSVFMTSLRRLFTTDR